MTAKCAALRWVVYEGLSDSPVDRTASGFGLPIIALRSGHVVTFVDVAKRRLLLTTTVHSFAFTPIGSADEYFIGYRRHEERGLTQLFKWNFDGVLMATRNISHIYVAYIQILADGCNLVTTTLGGTNVHYIYSADFSTTTFSICQNVAIVSPDGTKIALSNNNTIRVVGCDMRRTFGPLVISDGVIEWSPCSRYLITGSYDRRLVLIDTWANPMTVAIKPNCYYGFSMPMPSDTITQPQGPPRHYHFWDDETQNMKLFDADGLLIDSVRTMGDALCPSWVSHNVWIEVHGRSLVACAWRKWDRKKWYAIGGSRPTARVLAMAASLPNGLLGDIMSRYVNLL